MEINRSLSIFRDLNLLTALVAAFKSLLFFFVHGNRNSHFMNSDANNGIFSKYRTFHYCAIVASQHISGDYVECGKQNLFETAKHFCCGRRIAVVER